MKRITIVFLAICSTWNIYAQTGQIFVDENHNNHKITGLPTPAATTEAATKGYVDSVTGGGAPSTAHYVTTQAEGGLSAEFSLGSLASGLLKQSVTTGVSTPAIAVPLTDYWDTTVFFSTDVSSSPGLVPDPGTSASGTKFLNNSGEFIDIPGNGSGVSQLISGGGVAWTGSGFDYIISGATYLINGVQYSSAQTPVTLDPADPSDPRFDTFYVDTGGLAGVLTGTAGSGIAPSVDPSSQLLLTTAEVPAGSSEPTITNEDIYLENTEYTMSASGGTINLASTNNPFAGTKDIEGTSTVAGNFFTALKPSGTLDLSQYTQLVFQIRSKATWPNNKGIAIFWLNGTTVTGSSVGLKNGTFGFNSSNTSTYQQIVIPAANFGTGVLPVDRLRMSVSGGGAAIGWYIDNIILQAGGGGGGGGGTVTNFTAGNLSPLFTTSVTNPTTAPNLAFTLSTAGAHTFFANNTGSTSAPSFTSFLAGTNYEVPLTASKSITRTTNDFALTNDSTTPGNSKYYGTDSGGTRGYFTLPSTTVVSSLGFTNDGSGTTVTTGVKGYFTSPYACTITGWSIAATGSSPTCTIDVWKIGTGTALPTVANTITASAKPALATGNAIRSSTLTAWTTSVSAGDIFGFNLDAVSNATRITFELEVTR